MSLAACNPSSLRFRSICRLRARAARSSADIAQPIFRPTFARAEIFTRAAIIRAPVAGWVATRDDDDDDDEVRPRRSPTVNCNGAAPVLCRSSRPSPAAVLAVMVTHVPGGCCCSCAVQLLLLTTLRAGTGSAAVGLRGPLLAGRADTRADTRARTLPLWTLGHRRHTRGARDPLPVRARRRRGRGGGEKN